MVVVPASLFTHRVSKRRNIYPWIEASVPVPGSSRRSGRGNGAAKAGPTAGVPRRLPRYGGFLLPLNVAIGGLLLVAVVAAACRRARPRRHGANVTAVGWLLVAVPLPVVVALQLLGLLPASVAEAAFLVAASAFAVGAFLVLGRDDDPGLGRADDDPPWWPDFERGLRLYTGSRDRDRVGSR